MERSHHEGWGHAMRGDDGLSDAERRRLTEIESSLRAEDPDFVQRFERRRLRRRRWRNILAPMALGVAVVVIVLALVRGSVGGAVIGLLAAGAAAGLWVTRRGA
ncbi:MAG TPA: DUF3040 domain-containing protein [Actinoplanes sp.]|nr:DUF3040 domain-containing protein [Actinoplanes sp.]